MGVASEENEAVPPTKCYATEKKNEIGRRQIVPAAKLFHRVILVCLIQKNIWVESSHLALIAVNVFN